MPRTKTIAELKAEKKKIEEKIEAAERDAAIEQIRSTPEFKAVAKKLDKFNLSGAEIAKLFSSKKAPAARRKKAPQAKYRHPSDPKLTWSGRGRKPAWVQEWEKSGKALAGLAAK